MKTKKSSLDACEAYYDKLRDFLEHSFYGLLYQLPYNSVLDIGAGLAISPNISLREEIETVLVSADKQLLDRLQVRYRHNRFQVIVGRAETLDLIKSKYDLALFMLSLPWLDDPVASLEKVASISPEYIFIAEPRISSQAPLRTGPPNLEYHHEILKRLQLYCKKGIALDDLMLKYHYYPLVVYRCTAMHPLRAVIYSKEKPDRIIYEKAKYIFQVNSMCNGNCADCYVAKTGNTMDESRYRELLQDVNPGDIITLRGGEPTMTENLLKDFLAPALATGAYLILESNGYFIDSAQYGDYLDALSNQNVEVKLSVDINHIGYLSDDKKQVRLDSLAGFIEEAKQRNIGWGLTALGMHKKQTEGLLRKTALAPYLDSIRPLTKYSHIEDLPLKGKYVDVEGRGHRRIKGISNDE